MSNSRPQVTGVLISRLQRVARFLDREAASHLQSVCDYKKGVALEARANTCWQAAARLEELLKQLRGPND